MSVLDPFSHALAAVVATAHAVLTSLGADPSSGVTWLLCIVAVVAMNADLVASLGAATLVGVPMAEHGYLGAGWAHLVLVTVLVGTAAALSYVTQKYLVAPNTVVAELPEVLARTHQLMPVLTALGVAVAGGVVPVALLVYWVCNGLWTLGQSAVVCRWFPTPGSPAAERARSR